MKQLKVFVVTVVMVLVLSGMVTKAVVKIGYVVATDWMQYQVEMSYTK